MNYNKVIIAGNLTRDPELRYAQSGSAIAKIGLAVNRTWKDANGEKKDEVVFVDCTAFGKTAETMGQYLKSGKSILVDGRLQLDTWEDKTTREKRSKLCVVVESFQFGGEAKGEPKTKAQPAAPAPAQPELPAANEDDDVPF